MKKAEQANFPEFEAEMLKVWREEKTFEQSLKNREGSPRFNFYDGPPFANGLPHYGHVVALTEKDAITRYKTMTGHYVPRRNGWDTHGLPVEIEVEKQLGINSKREILEMGIDKFNAAAKASVFKYKQEWEDFMTRLGRWSDQENSYATLDDNYIESVWNVLHKLHEKKMVYRSFRSNPYCPRCATPLSNFEVNQNYKDNVTDPSVYVKFELTEHPGVYLLAWTTTPWTLPANAALAVKADAKYVHIEMTNEGDGWNNGDQFWLASDRINLLDLKSGEYKNIGSTDGKTLAGTKYKPLYDYSILLGAAEEKKTNVEKAYAHRVYVDDSVSLEDGTGILHVAPRYGETDLALGLREGLPLIESVNGDGKMVDEFKSVEGLEEIAGKFFKSADNHIIADLTKKGRIFAAETFEHTYPFCWRCETPLMYFAMQTWYIKVSEMQDKLVETNNQINWVPEHIKQGRFGNWLSEARDWNFARNRFWGAPLPIWMNVEDESDIIVIGSLDELRKLSGHEGDFDLHRPGIDTIEINRDGKTYKRVEEVFDCWFESGSMPYAQDHYPFEHKEDFEKEFPAQFIAEGLDQTRGWFYTLHVLGTALFDKPAFTNVVVNGLVLAADGKKLSKRLKNYPDPNEIFASTGADSLRFFLMSSPVVGGEDVRFSAEAVTEVSRNVFMRLWNVYSFFSTYAEVDKWTPGKELAEPKSENVLDQWLIARLNQTIAEVTKQAEEYKIAPAVRPLRELIDDLSNWYVRRSRRRFWKSEDDGDKAAAYATLHYTLLRIAQLLAPWSPFVADKLWRELSEGMDVPASVHLSDWPKAGKVNASSLSEMRDLRQGIEEGLAARAEAGIKVRQPLLQANLYMDKISDDSEVMIQYVNIAEEELNVKEATIGEVLSRKTERPKTIIELEITNELKLEGLARDLIRQIQIARKANEYEVNDRIDFKLHESTPGELTEAYKKFFEVIAKETLMTTQMQDSLVIGQFNPEGWDDLRLKGYVASYLMKKYNKAE